MHFKLLPLIYWTNCSNCQGHWAFRIMTSWQKGIWRQVFPSVMVTYKLFLSLWWFIEWIFICICWSRIANQKWNSWHFSKGFWTSTRLLWIYSWLLLPPNVGLSFLSALKHDDLKECSVRADRFQVFHSYSMVLSHISVASTHFHMHAWAVSCALWEKLNFQPLIHCSINMEQKHTNEHHLTG